MLCLPCEQHHLHHGTTFWRWKVPEELKLCLIPKPGSCETLSWSSSPTLPPTCSSLPCLPSPPRGLSTTWSRWSTSSSPTLRWQNSQVRLEMLNCSYNTQMVANLRESWEGLWEGKNERGCLPKPIELLIILWVQVMHLPNETCKKMQSGLGWAPFQYVQGLAWAEIKQLWKDGLLAYITVPWNLADIFTIANFMGWIGRFFSSTR